MIAAVTAPTKLLFNWFDLALVFIVAFGFWRGRKNGMSKEFVPVLQWLVTVIGGAVGYRPLGDLLIRQGVVKYVFGKNFEELTAAYLTAYLLIALVVLVVFSTFKRKAKARLEGSTLFGDSEYYLGIVAGVLRYFSILLFALALLNAPVYSQADILRAKAYNNRWFGGGLSGYSGDFFPSVSEVQASIFKDSLTGPFLKNGLSVLLINTVSDHLIKPGGQGEMQIIQNRPR